MPGSRYEDLVAQLGADVAGAVRDWRRANGFTVRIPVRPWRSTDGYSGASLHTLIVDDGEGAQQVVVKVIPPYPGRVFGVPEEGEPERHRKARQASAEFAQAHLVRSPFPALLTSAGQVVMFQTVAGDGGHCFSLADLPPERLGEASAFVVGELVRSWNAEWLSGQRLTVRTFLRMEAGDALTPTGTIRRWADPAALLDIKVPWIRLPGEGKVLPNPLLLALGVMPFADQETDVVVGYAHGDLHMLNILLPEQRDGTADVAGFRLIDLASSHVGSLTHDPVCLMLSALTRFVDKLSAADQEELIEAIVDTTPSARTETPFRLVATIRAAFADAVFGAGRGWAGVSAPQFVLSTLAIALVFTSYERLSPQVRWWFFRLSAHAGLKLVQGMYPAIFFPADGRMVENLFGGTVSAAPVAASDAACDAASVVASVVADDTFDSDFAVEFDRIRALGEQDNDSIRAVQAARALWRDAVERRGPEHRLSLSARYTVAAWLEKSGQASDALRMYEETLAVARRVLGDADPLTMECEKAYWSRDLHRRAESEGQI